MSFLRLERSPTGCRPWNIDVVQTCGDEIFGELPRRRLELLGALGQALVRSLTRCRASSSRASTVSPMPENTRARALPI